MSYTDQQQAALDNGWKEFLTKNPNGYKFCPIGDTGKLINGFVWITDEVYFFLSEYETGKHFLFRKFTTFENFLRWIKTTHFYRSHKKD